MPWPAGREVGDDYEEPSACCVPDSSATQPHARLKRRQSTETVQQQAKLEVCGKALTKRQRCTLFGSSQGEERSCSDTWMPERTISHSYASSDSSSGSVSSSPSPQYEHCCSHWHQLPAPVPATFSQVAWLQPPRSASFQRWELLSSLDFSPDGSQLAAAGVGKHVRVYPVSTGPQQQEVIHPSCSYYLASKLSCLCWSPVHEDILAIGDYDGMVTQLHTATGHTIWQVDDHDGARIWSVNFSQRHPDLLASACEDGTAKLWNYRSTQPLTIISPKSRAAVCSAVFSPADSNLLALGSADRCAYVYDIRAPASPLFTLYGHQGAVSYVKFLGLGQDVVTASVDGTLAHWSISGTSQQPQQRQSERHTGLSSWVQPEQCTGLSSQPSSAAQGMQISPVRVFRGHKNSRNFVGLAVEPSTDLIACGSEDSEVYLFHTAWADPMGHQPLGRAASRQSPSDPPSHQSAQRPSPKERSFASAVAWQPRSNSCNPNDQLLAAALSDSGIQLFRPQCHHTAPAARS